MPFLMSWRMARFRQACNPITFAASADASMISTWSLLRLPRTRGVALVAGQEGQHLGRSTERKHTARMGILMQGKISTRPRVGRASAGYASMETGSVTKQK